MDFIMEILPFIIFALIAASKSKKNQGNKNQRGQNSSTKPNTEKKVRKGFFDLEELKKAAENMKNEMQQILEEKEIKSSTNHTTILEDHEKSSESLNYAKAEPSYASFAPNAIETAKPMERSQTNTVQAHGLTFHKKAMIDAVIMSEILSKPKALRHK